MSYIEKEKLIKADIASIENRVRHAFNQGYDLGFKDGKGKAKPLEQEPTTKNDLGVDCISRDEVCRYVAEFVNHEFSTKEEEELIDNIITGIERMPSVTPQEPKTGHWINISYYDGGYGINETCSECGCTIHGQIFDLIDKYCPNCGADMREVEE